MKEKQLFIPKDVVLVLGLAVVFSVGRIALFHSYYFVYLMWNVFLAVLPFVVSSFLLYFFYKNKLNTFMLLVGGIFWILLLPNSPYIITDFVHLARPHGVPFYYDIFLVFSCAWVGLLLFVYSLSHIEEIIVLKYGKLISKIKIPSIILLVSIGIYIGRYLRFNSWDIFTDPNFFDSTWKTFIHPTHFTEACFFVIPCFLFLYIFYTTWKYSKKKVTAFNN